MWIFPLLSHAANLSRCLELNAIPVIPECEELAMSPALEFRFFPLGDKPLERGIDTEDTGPVVD
jgi:hypothetical protein